MTRQEELVWAAAWALGMRERRELGMTVRERDAAHAAATAVGALREAADDPKVQTSDDWTDVLLRQMAGEPDCWVRRREAVEPQRAGGGVWLGCELPRHERCEACARFHGWPEDEDEEEAERCPQCGCIPQLENDLGDGRVVYACCGAAWPGSKKKKEAP